MQFEKYDFVVNSTIEMSIIVFYPRMINKEVSVTKKTCLTQMKS